MRTSNHHTAQRGRNLFRTVMLLVWLLLPGMLLYGQNGPEGSVPEERPDGGRQETMGRGDIFSLDDSSFQVMPFGSIERVDTRTYQHSELSATPPPKKHLYIKEDPADEFCSDRQIRRATINARLKMGPNDYEFDHTTFDVEMRLRIAMMDSTDTVRRYICTLRILSDGLIVKPEQLFQKDFTDIYDDIDSMVVTVEGYTTTYASGAATALQNNLRLEIFFTDEFATTSLNASALTTPAVGIDTLPLVSNVVTANPVTFRWKLTPACGNDSFPNYQFQLLRLFNRDGSKSPDDEYAIRDSVEWARALTIETGSSETSLTLTIAEGSGYYVWRVRPIGDHYPGGIANDRNWGVWSTAPPEGGIVNLTGVNESSIDTSWRRAVFFYRQFDADKNWIYKRTFTEGAEGTRISEGVTYATELMQPRQTQAHMQSKDTMLVSQTVLDYSGRPSFGTLAAPVAWSGFGYQDLFTPRQGGLYTAANFDDSTRYLNPDTLASGDLYDYYSDLNPDLRIPNAHGYPFTRTLYYPDGTGRVREQGGAGPVHRIGGGADGESRTIRTMYGAPSDAELIAMFGDEAPASNTVQKVTTFEPNRVAMVNYISKEGKTIATCLVKSMTANALLTELPEQTVFNQTVTERIGNNVQLGEYGIAANTVITLPDTTTITLRYSISPKEIESECASYCAVCDYRVRIAVISLARPMDSIFHWSHVITPGECGEEHELDTTLPTLELPSGSYMVLRTITANDTDASGDHYRDLHLRAVDSLIRRQDSIALHRVNGYLDDADPDGLYTYLDSLVDASAATFGYDSATADSIYTITTSCCTLNVPKRECPKSPCPDLKFEQLLYDTWGPGRYAYNGDTSKHYGNTLDKYFYSDLETPLFPHTGPNSSGRNGFDTLIAHMIADGYDCDTLWGIWQELVMSFGVISADDNIGDPDDRQFGFNLLEVFLTRAGKRYEGISNCPYGDTCSPGYGKGYLDYAHRYFKYTSDAGSEECRKINIGADPVTGLADSLMNGNVPVNPLPWNADNRHDSAQYKQWETFYNCLYIKENPPSQTPQLPFECEEPYDSTCVLAMREAAIDTCRTRCEQRWAGFKKTLIDAYHEVGKAVEGDRYTPDGERIDSAGWVLDSLGEPTSTQVELASIEEIDCQVATMIEHCQDHCSLTVSRDTNGAITEVGTPAERVAFEKAMSYTWRVALPDSASGTCSGGDTLLSSAYSLRGRSLGVVRHLNEKMRQIRASGGDTLSADSLARYYYNAYLAYSGDTASACQWYLDVTSDSTTSSECCPPTGMPAIFTLDTNITGRFILDDSCRIIYVRTCWLDGVAITQRDTLCTRACVASCASTICFRWEALQAPDTNVVMRPYSCEELVARYLRGTIGYQVEACVYRHRAGFDADYHAACTSPSTLADTLTVEYGVALYHFTLYYHDRAGHLVRTVPPRGVSLNATSRAVHPTHTLFTSYEYNSLGQLVKQKTPDGGITQFWYNSRGQLRFAQSAEQSARSAFSYTKYDALGRTIESGESSYGTTNPLDDEADDMDYPSANLTEVYRTVYTTSASRTYLDDAGRPQRFLRNRVSYVVNGDSSLASSYSYDPHGNVEWLVQYIRGLGSNFVRYDYDLISNNVLAVHYNEGLGDQLTQRYAYDEDNRLRLVESSRDGKIWDRDATYHYYLHGPLRRVEYGEDSLQGVDYTYTLQGWLKGMNHASLDTNTDPGADGDLSTNVHRKYASDAFGMVLGYYAGDFQRKTSSQQSPFNSSSGGGGYTVRGDTVAGTNLYNGNIGSWASRAMASGGAGKYYEVLTGERYRYDRLNRLLSSDFSWWDVDKWGETADYDTWYRYDPNGNIDTLIRNGSQLGTHQQMDSLAYHYAANTNRLTYVDDDVAAGLPNTDIDDQSSGNYGYDASGRLTSDVQEGITQITWSPYNKVREVRKNGGMRMRFTYDAMGNRVRKSVLAGTSGTTTYYVYDAGGKVLAIYTKPCLDIESEEDGTGGPDGCVDTTAPADNDMDGVPNSQDNAINAFNPEQRDSDGDGQGDVVDADIDNDGINNIADGCDYDPLNNCTGDADSDGVPDISDPCPNIPGNGGADRDGDGTPDGCDGDLDGDGDPNNEDNCPWKYNPMQEDTNSNQIGDSCECGLGGGPSYGSCLITLGEQFVYGSGGDGRVATVTPNQGRDMESHAGDSIFTRELLEKQYELNDHLGNVRVRFSDLKKNVTAAGLPPFKVDLRGYVHYYPFGMAQPGREMDMAGGRYGYNGKEMDNEWNDRQGAGGNVGTGGGYDYGARMLSPRLGRFLNLDPLAPKYPDLSPYILVANMPIHAVDIDGRDIIVLSAPKNVAGLGHAAVLIGDDKTGWYLYSKNGTTWPSGSSGPSNQNDEVGIRYESLSQFANEANFNPDGSIKYLAAFRIKSSKSQDQKMKEAANQTLDEPYLVYGNSCIDLVSDALKAGGFDPGWDIYMTTKTGQPQKGLNAIPNTRFEAIVRNNNKKGSEVTSDIMPNSEIALQKRRKGQNKESEERTNGPSKENLLQKGIRFIGEQLDKIIEPILEPVLNEIPDP